MSHHTPTSRHAALIAAGLLLTSAVTHAQSDTTRTPAPGPPLCGVERWAIKTLSDDDAPLLDLTHVTETTIRDLGRLPAPTMLPEAKRVAPVETTVYAVTARVLRVRLEDDHDFHLVLQDPDHPEATLIAEVPDPTCAGAADSPYVATLTSVREAVVELLHQDQLVGQVIRIRGVGFWDYDHGQGGKAPNGIELHPVLRITALVEGQ